MAVLACPNTRHNTPEENSFKMAEIDELLRSSLPNILAPIVVILILFVILRKPLNTCKEKIFAYIFHRLISTFNKRLGDQKEELFAPLWDLKGEKKDFTLMEIGVGGGANFKFYPQGTSIVSVDPNPHCESYLKKNASLFPHIKLKEFINAAGEDLAEIPDNYCDAVVCTLVLCSVKDVDRALKEVKRVLKPGGVFFYLDHIAADPSTWTYTLQYILNPFWRIFADGCNLNRETWRNLEQAGFSNLEYRRFRTRSLLVIIQYLLAGTAMK